MLNEGVSVIVCCYNSTSRIKKTLQHLARQCLKEINCEIILIDNASSDNTAEAARSEWVKTGNKAINFNIIYEPIPGLAFARAKGINEAQFEFLIFCDDDNWLDVHYVENVFMLFKSNENVAVLGGIGIAEFEDPLSKPAWFEKLYHGYAVGPQAEEESFVSVVYGAGMAVRNSVLKKAMSYPMFLHDRKKNDLTAGGDSEICYRIILLGYQILYSPKLTFKHFITTQRLTWNYLKRLYLGFSKGAVILNLYQIALNADIPELPAFYWLKKALYYFGIYLKYWPKHYLEYKKGEGSVDEIHHLVWKSTAVSYFGQNFKTIRLYRSIFMLKNFKIHK